MGLLEDMAQAQNYGFHIFPPQSRTYSARMLLSTQEEKRDINYCVFQRSVALRSMSVYEF